MERVHKIDRVLEIGEELLVPHIRDIAVLWPVHTDKHDGQNVVHGHGDPRFGASPSARPELQKREKIKWLPRIVVPTITGSLLVGSTPLGFVENAIKKINHAGCNHILKGGKCPHAGFNLNQVPVLAGIVTCPMHQMRFTAHDGKGKPWKAFDYYWGGLKKEHDWPKDDFDMWLEGTRGEAASRPSKWRKRKIKRC